MNRALIKLAVTIAAMVAMPVAVAAAQPAEAPAGHPAPAHGADGHGAHEAHDPSQHFNWFSNPAPFGGSSYKAKDLLGGPLGDNALGPDATPLSPGATEAPMSAPFILVLINFGIVLFLIGWKVGPLARQMSEKRSDDIKGALDEAARLRTQAADKLAEYSNKLRAAESEIDQLIKDMRSDAEAERARIIAAAEAQAAALKKDAEERIATEIERARYALQREVVYAATAVAETLLRSKTTPTDQASLVDTFIRNVEGAARGATDRT